MPAAVQLKTMPKSCVHCPFSSRVVCDELPCLLLDYNKVDYSLSGYGTDLTKERRKECPLVFTHKKYKHDGLTVQEFIKELDSLPECWKSVPLCDCFYDPINTMLCTNNKVVLFTEEE